MPLEVMWSRSMIVGERERGTRGGSGRFLLYMLDFLCVTASLEAGQLLVLVCFTDNQLLHC